MSCFFENGHYSYYKHPQFNGCYRANERRWIEMSVVKIITLVGESEKSWEEATHKVIAEAQETLRGITRIGISEFDVRMKDDKVDVYRVKAEISFRVEHQ
jgi:flavin-binding protein dodecin